MCDLCSVFFYGQDVLVVVILFCLLSLSFLTRCVFGVEDFVVAVCVGVVVDVDVLLAGAVVGVGCSWFVLVSVVALILFRFFLCSFFVLCPS